MPRVSTKKKSKAGKPYHCGKCGKKIVPGEMYYEWSFRYGGTRRQHEKCGRPSRGQLTQSKLGAVYDACDGAEETISKATEKDAIVEALNSAAETAREVSEEYNEAAEAMGAAGESGTSAERRDELESFADSLESAASEIEGEEFDEDDGIPETEWIENLRQQGLDALGELSL